MSERYSRCETCGGSVCECTAEEIIKAALDKNPKLTIEDIAKAAAFGSVLAKKKVSPEKYLTELAYQSPLHRSEVVDIANIVVNELIVPMQREHRIQLQEAKAAAFTEAAETCEDYAMNATETAASEMAGSLKYSMQSRAKEILETINQKPA